MAEDLAEALNNIDVADDASALDTEDFIDPDAPTVTKVKR